MKTRIKDIGKSEERVDPEWVTKKLGAVKVIKLTTTQIYSDHEKELKEQGWVILDITVKNGTKTFAPTWDMVNSYKYGSLSEKEYTSKYLEMMRESFRKNVEKWEKAISMANRQGLALACFCKPGEFCHRTLLIQYLEKFAKARGYEVEIFPETRNDSDKKTGDGVDHINIYSKGETELGRLLSNFAAIKIKIGNRTYGSIEAYWYFLGVDWGSAKNVTAMKEEQARLVAATGFNAKSLGRWAKKEFGEKTRPDFQEQIKAAMRLKVLQNPHIETLLKESTLPFRHYYNFNGKIRDAGFKWIVDEWEKIRKELQKSEKVVDTELEEALKERSRRAKKGSVRDVIPVLHRTNWPTNNS